MIRGVDRYEHIFLRNDNCFNWAGKGNQIEFHFLHLIAFTLIESIAMASSFWRVRWIVIRQDLLVRLFRIYHIWLPFVKHSMQIFIRLVFLWLKLRLLADLLLSLWNNSLKQLQLLIRVRRTVDLKYAPAASFRGLCLLFPRYQRILCLFISRRWWEIRGRFHHLVIIAWKIPSSGSCVIVKIHFPQIGSLNNGHILSLALWIFAVRSHVTLGIELRRIPGWINVFILDFRLIPDSLTSQLVRTSLCSQFLSLVVPIGIDSELMNVVLVLVWYISLSAFRSVQGVMSICFYAAMINLILKSMHLLFRSASCYTLDLSWLFMINNWHFIALTTILGAFWSMWNGIFLVDRHRFDCRPFLRIKNNSTATTWLYSRDITNFGWAQLPFLLEIRLSVHEICIHCSITIVGFHYSFGNTGKIVTIWALYFTRNFLTADDFTVFWIAMNFLLRVLFRVYKGLQGHRLWTATETEALALSYSLDYVQTENLGDSWAVFLPSLHAQIVDIANCFYRLITWHCRWQLGDLHWHNSLLQSNFVLIIVRPLAHDHLVQDAAESPHVRLLVIRLAFEHLRTAVGKCAGVIVRKVVTFA